jgi:hypothetical protein
VKQAKDDLKKLEMIGH